MKKSLLFLSAVACMGMANAQVVVGLATSADLEAAGLASDKVEMEPKMILENDAATFELAYANKWGTTTTYKNYRNITVNGEAITLGSGAVGTDNPTFVSFEAGCPSAGAVFKFECYENGYMTVFTKMNPNKQYLVYENSKNGAIVYTVGWANGTQQIHYSMPNNGKGYIDTNSPDASKYLVAATKQATNEDGVKLWQNKENPDEIVASAEKPTEGSWQPYNEIIPGQSKPQMPWITAGFESAPGESTGFLTFPVYAGAYYYFCALGSKAACSGFVWTENDPKIVYQEVLADDGSVSLPAVEFNPLIDPSAVETVEAVENADAPVYNMMGVRVNADAKGILIQNGKKFIRK